MTERTGTQVTPRRRRTFNEFLAYKASGTPRDIVSWRTPNRRRFREMRREPSRGVFVTGLAVDHHMEADWKPRFPDTDQAIEAATMKIHAVLDNLYQEARAEGEPLRLVLCSATAGTDLISLEWALKKVMESEGRHEKPDIFIQSYLGYDKKAFIKDAVAVEEKVDEKTGKTYAGNDSEHNQEWLRIFKELDKRGLIIEPKFKNPLRRLLYVGRSTPHEAIKKVFKKRFGKTRKVFNQLNERMMREIRQGDYLVAFWEGGEPRGLGGTVDAADQALKIIGDDSHAYFIDPNGIVPVPDGEPPLPIPTPDMVREAAIKMREKFSVVN